MENFDDFDNSSDSDNLDDNINIIQVKHNNLPWVEKYRPKKLTDVIQQEEIIKILNKTIETGELPHLLLFGPPGTGKTSTILCTAMQLFGPKRIEERVLELNASDDRGIGVVRNTIISFSKIAIGTVDPDYPSPPYKIIILDEADSMTPEAQAALRKVMETMSGITRFCFICNYITQIIEPIASRCMKFRFKPINNTAIIQRLKLIAKNEKIDIKIANISKIAEIANGDARRAIMILQNLKYLSSHKKSITLQDIVSITGGVDESKFSKIWQLCLTGSILDLRNITIQICRDGYQISNILTFLKNKLLASDIDDISKAKIFIELSNTDRRLVESSDEFIQILNILTFINCAVKKIIR